MSDLTDFDLHLFGEGNHHHIYQKLGAHITWRDGAAGTRFAVWAPDAQRVSVVGDFNRWDGRQHVMHRRGGSGVWEIFIAQVGAGALYKYEIVTAQGHCVLKADPYVLSDAAAAQRAPPESPCLGQAVEASRSPAGGK